LFLFCFERQYKKNANNTKPTITATPPIVPPTIAPIDVDEGGEEEGAGVVATADENENEDVGVDVIGVEWDMEVVGEVIRLGVE
jgi:hypothetical protein